MSDLTTATPLGQRILEWTHTTRNVEHLLYGAITIEAVIIGVRYEKIVTTPLALSVAVWEACLGLSVAFFFAFALSRRLASPHALPFGTYLRFLPVILPLILVGIAASLGEVIGDKISPQIDSVTHGADFGIIVLCAVVTWLAALAHELTRARQLALVAIVVAFMTFVAELKSLLGH
ncbi:MAG: hypothetical protein WCL12_01870 [Actinomycetes bacterium]